MNSTPGMLPGPGERAMAVVVSGEDLPTLLPLLTAFGLLVFTPQRLVEEYVLQTKADGTILSGEIPAGFIGAIAFSSESARALGDDEVRLAFFFHTFGFDLLDLSAFAESNRTAALSDWLARRLVLVGNLTFGDVSRVRGALFTLRQEHEEAMERFAALESSTARFTTPKRVIKLNSPASNSYTRLESHAGGLGRGIRQLLPTIAAGIACVELKFKAAPTGRGGSLQIDLFAGGNAAPVHRWTVPANRIHGGWNPFFLDRAVTSREQDAMLEITWTAEDQAAVSLNLGRPMPLDEVCCVLDTGVRLTAPLAFKVWSTAPGAIVAETEFVAPKVRYALGTDDLGSVRLLSPLSHDLNFSPVEFRPSEMDLLVHPILGATTVALVENISARRLEKLSGLVLVGRSESNPVEFGLAAVTRDTITGPPEAFIRQWTTVEAQIYAEIAGSVDITPGQPVDLILATRMLGDADPSFAWACFKRIEVVA